MKLNHFNTPVLISFSYWSFIQNAEVEEMRSTHSKRLERLKALQASYNVLKEQIKTYDAQER